MNKTIMYYFFILLQLLTSTTIMPMLRLPSAISSNLSKVPAKMPKIAGVRYSGTTFQPVYDKPQAIMSPENFKAFYNELLREGARQNSVGFLKVLRNNPSYMIDFQAALEKGQREIARKIIYQIRTEADNYQKSSKQSPTMLDIVKSKPEIDASLANPITNLLEALQTLEATPYQEVQFKNQEESLKTYHDIREEINKVQADLTETLNNDKINPQQGVSKLRTIDTSMKDIAQNLIDLSKQAATKSFKNKLTTIANSLNNLGLKVSQSADMLQKAPPPQPETISLEKLESLVQELNTPQSSEVATTHTTAKPDLNPIQEQVQATLEANIKASNNNLQQTQQLAQSLQTIIESSSIQQDKKQTLMQATSKANKELVFLQQVLNNVIKSKDYPQAMQILTNQKFAIQQAIENIVDSIQILHDQAAEVSPVAAKRIQSILQKMISEAMQLIEGINTTQLVAKEFELKKEILQQFKKSTDVMSLKSNASKSVAGINKSSSSFIKEIQEILTNFTELQPDIAPASSISMIKFQTKKIKEIIQKLDTITDLDQLNPLHAELVQEVKLFNNSIDMLVSKINAQSLTKVSAQKRKYLEMLARDAKIHTQELLQYFENILHKAGSLEKEMLFVEIQKNEITMGIYRRTAVGEEIIAYIQDTMRQSALTSSEQKRLAELQKSLQAMKQKDTKVKQAKNLKELKKAVGADQQSANPLEVMQPIFESYDELIQKVKVAFGSSLGIGILTGASLLKNNDNEEEETANKNDVVNEAIYASIEKILNINKQLSEQTNNELKQTISKTQKFITLELIKKYPQQIQSILKNIAAQIKKSLAQLQSFSYEQYQHGKEVAFQQLQTAYKIIERRKSVLLESYEQWVEQTQQEIEEYLANDPALKQRA